jgi:hypothetical protein
MKEELADHVLEGAVGIASPPVHSMASHVLA